MSWIALALGTIAIAFDSSTPVWGSGLGLIGIALFIRSIR